MRFSSVWLLGLFSLLVASNVIFGRLDLSRRAIEPANELIKRKGGGGGGGGKGGSSGGGSKGGSSSSGSSSSSSIGGTSKGGSGAPRAYGGGGYYGGGAVVPYSAGSRSPKGLAPVAFLGLGALGGLYLFGAYSFYMYSLHPYSYYNVTSRLNETRNVNCLCRQYAVCGCDDNDDPAYYRSVIGDGDVSKFNTSLVNVATVNGTTALYIDGTLPNGTTADSFAAPRMHASPVLAAFAVVVALASMMSTL